MQLHDSHSLITAISYGLGLVGVAGLSFTYFRTNFAKTTLSIADENIKQLQTQVELLKESNVELKQQLLDQAIKHTAEIAALRQELATFKDLPLTQIIDNQKAGIDMLKALAERENVKTRA